jgi:hypothetical protein
MNGFERQVAGELSRRLAPSGLHVDHLDCPTWRGRVPARMSCQGYVSGMTSAVSVRLRATARRGVRLDAWLAEDLIATVDLEATVRRLGWTDADCGTVPVYRAVVGTRITCRVSRANRTHYVVATVRSRTGKVAVGPYGSDR